MSRFTTPLLRTALTTLHAVRAHRLMGRRQSMLGVIFMLHRVQPEPPPAFSPNRILSVTPQFLETTICETRSAGFAFVTLDEACRRMDDPERAETEKPFAVLTFDDGYRDNATYALPILKKYNVPAIVYVPSAFPDGDGDFWWLTLEEAIRRLDHVDVVLEGESLSLASRTTVEKDRAFQAIYWPLRRMNERVARDVVADLAKRAKFDARAQSLSLPMSWDTLRQINNESLITIGGHTVNHFAVGKLSADEARFEMSEGAKRLEQELQTRITHFSFPYGDFDSATPRDFATARDLGFRTAVTTQKGMVGMADGQSCRHALRRLSLNGDYQRAEYLRVLLSGLPFDLLNAAKQVRSLVNRRPHDIGRDAVESAGR